MWIVLRNRQHHRYATATEVERQSMYQPGDIISLGDWPDGPGARVVQTETMIAIEIQDRSTAEFKSWMKSTLVSRFGPAAESKFEEMFEPDGKRKRGWMIHLPTVLAGLTAAQRTWLQTHKNNISLTAAQFASGFASAIQRREGSDPV